MHTIKFGVAAAIFAASFSFLLGIFAYLKNAKGAQNRNFALFNIALALWNVGDMVSSIQDHHTALTLYRFSYIGASFVTYYVSTFFWSVANCRKPRLELVLKCLAIMFGVLSPTLLIIKDIHIDLKQLTPIEEIYGPLYYPFIVFFIVSLTYSVIPVISVYRKSNGYMRNQLRYIIAAVSIGILGTLSYVASQMSDIVPPLYCFLQVGVCAIFAAAILKHRLMDISVIIRKTLIYTGVMSILALVYLGIVTLFTRLFEGLTGYQTIFSSGVGAILFTLFFQPLRKRIQTFVDQKFFRQYVDREEKLYELSREVITHTTPEAMGGALLQVINQTLHPKAGALFLRARDGNGFVKVSGADSTILPDRMEEDNSLATYFKDHPQPFVQDMTTDTGQSHSTRLKENREDAA